MKAVVESIRIILCSSLKFSENMHELESRMKKWASLLLISVHLKLATYFPASCPWKKDVILRCQGCRGTRGSGVVFIRYGDDVCLRYRYCH